MNEEKNRSVSQLTQVQQEGRSLRKPTNEQAKFTVCYHGNWLRVEKKTWVPLISVLMLIAKASSWNRAKTEESVQTNEHIKNDFNSLERFNSFYTLMKLY